MNKMIPATLATLIVGALTLTSAQALPAWLKPGHEYHVATTGSDTNPGSKSNPLKTINAAAQKAMPGDTITVHAGVYREEIVPPRGGLSDQKRITYQAAPGEKVTITGSESAKGWEKVSGDTWKLVRPNSSFGSFNPFAERVHGDWFSGNGRVHHTGAVYLNGQWLLETTSLAAVMNPVAGRPLWFAAVDGVAADSPEYLMNVVSIKTGNGTTIRAAQSSAKQGTQTAPCSEGESCVGFIRNNDWLQYDKVNFGTGTDTLEIRAAATVSTGGRVEVRLDKADGELLGICDVPVTGDWQKWQSFSTPIKKTAGLKAICLVFKPQKPVAATSDNTTIYAQFPGIDPNTASVEIAARSSVFNPAKTNIDYLTIRGFDLRNAASNWAAPTSGQRGLVSAYWCKGWIIENNEISYSRCCGIALGKYSDEWDDRRGTTDGYYGTIDDALKKGGWSKNKIGGHIVRNNHIHHCEQTGIVGSLGCAFSRIENNEIHDIHNQGIWGGAEMAGIKFHGALDVVITGNHIYRCGHVGGLWLDWMAQGTHVTANLFHDNAGQDIFTEVDHGPFVIANNILLSHQAYLANSEGGAYAHNLITGSLHIVPDGRNTPFHKAHSTEMVGLHNCPVGDVRWINNVLASRCNLGAYNGASWPVTADGNVFTKGSHPSKFDTNALVRADFDAGITLTQKADGWYLSLNTDTGWRKEQKRPLVTTALLGKAKIPDLPFENADGSPLTLNTDYFGKTRNASNPFPGPIEITRGGKQEFKVWPK